MIATSHAPARSPSGFTLIEIAVVLVIVALLISMAAFFTRGIVAAQKRSTTVTRMSGVEAALTQFVMVNKRLPCPADGQAASGTEVRLLSGVCGNIPPNQQSGVVPWVSLGLSEVDATDGWDRRLTYRVAPELALNNALDMSQCDPAAASTGAAAPSCLPCAAGSAGVGCTHPADFLLAKGLAVWNLAGTPVMTAPTALPITSTGAAYVVISAGESGGGAYLNTGQLASSNATDGAEEINQNYADKPLAAHYVDDLARDAPTHFDDIVSRPSIMTVAQRAGLGPRSH